MKACTLLATFLGATSQMAAQSPTPIAPTPAAGGAADPAAPMNKAILDASNSQASLSQYDGKIFGSPDGRLTVEELELSQAFATAYAQAKNLRDRGFDGNTVNSKISSVGRELASQAAARRKASPYDADTKDEEYLARLAKQYPGSGDKQAVNLQEIARQKLAMILREFPASDALLTLRGRSPAEVLKEEGARLRSIQKATAVAPDTDLLAMAAEDQRFQVPGSNAFQKPATGPASAEPPTFGQTLAKVVVRLNQASEMAYRDHKNVVKLEHVKAMIAKELQGTAQLPSPQEWMKEIQRDFPDDKVFDDQFNVAEAARLLLVKLSREYPAEFRMASESLKARPIEYNSSAPKPLLELRALDAWVNKRLENGRFIRTSEVE